MSVPEFFFIESKLDANLVLDAEDRTFVLNGTSYHETVLIVKARLASDYDSQLWRVGPDGTITNKKTAKVLDVLGGVAAEDQPVILWPRKDSGQTNQQWSVASEFGTIRSMLSAQAGGLSVKDGIAAPGTAVVLHSMDSPLGVGQTWRVVGLPSGHAQPQMVLHQGRVITFARSALLNDPAVYYRFVDEAGQPTAFRPLALPGELRSAGFELLTVPGEAGEGLSHEPFRVVSDQTYVYLFQCARFDATLRVSRYTIVQTPGARDEDPPVLTLEPAWELRYRNSRRKDLPAGDADSVGYTAPNGIPFVEPMTELSMVRGLVDGRFQVLLVPGQDRPEGRWQVFALLPDPPVRVALYSFARDPSGLFDLSDKAVDPQTGQIPPDATFALKVSDADGTRPVGVTTGFGAVAYNRQEPVAAGDAGTLTVKRSGRVLLAFGVDGGRPAVVDFAVAADGTLADPGLDSTLTLTPIDPARRAIALTADANVVVDNTDATLGLKSSFTLQAWVRVDPAPVRSAAARTIIGAPANGTDSAAPYLHLVGDGDRIEVGFGEGQTRYNAQSTDPVVPAGSWQQITAGYNASTGRFTAFVNGAAVAMTAGTAPTPGAVPAGTPITSIGGGFVGQLDEIRVWRVAPTEDPAILGRLFDALPDPVCTTNPNLAGYWPCDVVTVGAGGLTTPDVSRHGIPASTGNDGHLNGAVLRPTDSPVAAAHLPSVRTDSRGLDIRAGLLPVSLATGYGHGTPYLVSGTDGILHMYVEGADGGFDTALFDTRISRAVFGLPWRSAAGESGELALVSRRPGAVMNKTFISLTVDDATTGTLLVSTPAGQKETWQRMPRELDAMAQVLNGEATGDPTDPRLAAGETVYFDYSGRYPTARLAHGGGELPVVGVRAGEGDAPAIGDIVLREATVAPSADPAVGNLTLRFGLPGTKAQLVQSWPDVPLDAARLVATLNGQDASYAYDRARAGDTPVFTIDTTGEEDILAVATLPDVTSVRVTVTGDRAEGPDRCAVSVAVSRQGATSPTTLTWSAVPREQNAFVHHLQTTAAVQGGSLSTYAVLSTDGLDASPFGEPILVPDQSTTGQPSDLRVAASLVRALPPAYGGTVGRQTVQADRDQKVVVAGPVSGPPELGSGLVAAIPVTLPVTGEPAVVAGTPKTSLLRLGTDGGWLTDAPRNALTFDGTGRAQPAALNTEALGILDDLTVEAWVTPQLTDRPAGTSIPDRVTRVLHTNLPGIQADGSDAARYMLGLVTDACLNLPGPSSPACALELDNGANPLTGPQLFSVLLWTRILLTTHDVPQTIWKLTLGDTALKDARTMQLLVDKAGRLSAGTADGLVELGGTRPMSSGRWTHLAVVCAWAGDGTARLTLYVDGVTAGSATVPAPVVTVLKAAMRATLRVGPEPGGIGPMQVNHVQVVKRGLTPAEVAAAAGSVLPLATQGLTLWWPMTTVAATVENIARNQADVDIAVPRYATWLRGALAGICAARGDRAVSTDLPCVIQDRPTHVAATYTGGGALRFDGASRARCTPSEALDFESEMSVAAWYQAGTVTLAQEQMLVGRWSTDDSGRSWRLGLNPDGYPFAEVMLDSQTTPLRATAAVRPNPQVGHLLVATLTRHPTEVAGEQPTGQYRLNLVVDDAAAVSAMPSTGAKRIASSGVPLTLGCGTATDPVAGAGPAGETGAGPWSYTGLLGQVRLWERALTESEVRALWKRDAIIKDGLVASWEFTEGTGRMARDAAGDNDLALSADELWSRLSYSTRIEVRVNGQPQAVSQLGQTAVWGESPQFSVGRWKSADDPSPGYRGGLNELRLWAGRRSPAQLAAHRFGALCGTEAGLRGYWPLSAGSGTVAVDLGPYGTNLTVSGGRWTLPASPQVLDTPLARNAIGGIATPYQVSACSPVAVDYPVTDVDGYGTVYSVMKRAYAYLDGDGRLETNTDFTVDELDTVYIGQAQTSPTLIGYVEGPPPLPSENLTLPYHMQTGWSDYRQYAGRSSLTLTEADDTTFRISGTRDTGIDAASDFKGGPGFEALMMVEPPAMAIEALNMQNFVRVHFSSETELGNRQDRSLRSALGTTIGDTLTMNGDWEGGDDVLDAGVGRRFLPDNVGYALVKSYVANVYAVRLRGSGALVALSVLPDTTVAPQSNVITFALNPGYIKQGTLDGWVGTTKDPDTGTSYYRPAEEARLRRRVEQQAARVKMYWDQFNAVKLGQSGAEDVDGQVPDGFAAPRSFVNAYAWSAGGGLHREQESQVLGRGESFTGSNDFKWMLGVNAEVVALWSSVGLKVEADSLAGQRIDISVEKDSDSSSAFGLDVDLDVENFLKGAARVNEDGSVTYTDGPVPGKVDGYRFSTFYLAPDPANFDDFRDQVVDPVWLRSGTPAANALRAATRGANGVWRVLHRVSYVSRIPPKLQPMAGETTPPARKPPAGLSGNVEVLTVVGQRLNFATNPTAQQIAAAVGQVVDGRAHDEGPNLAKMLPWWTTFLAEAETDPATRRIRQGLHADLLRYVSDAYATGAMPTG